MLAGIGQHFDDTLSFFFRTAPRREAKTHKFALLRLLGELFCPKLICISAIPKLPSRLSKFANKETGVELLENVRGQDVYVVQTGGGDRGPSINDVLTEGEEGVK